MTSTSFTNWGGVVAVCPVPKAPPPGPTKMDELTAIFLRGEPQCLGVVQILIGVLCILFSLTAAYSSLVVVHAPLCLAAAFVVSGALALAALRRTSVCMVWATLVWNLTSAVVGLMGVAYVCWLLADRLAAVPFCEKWGEGQQATRECMMHQRLLNVTVLGSLGLLLVLLVLQVCAAVAVSVFSGRAIRRHGRYTPVTVEVNDLCPPPSGTASPNNSDVTLLDSDGEETPRWFPNSP